MHKLILMLSLLLTFSATSWAGSDYHGKHHASDGYYEEAHLTDATKQLVKSAKRLHKRLKKETGYGAISYQARDLLTASRKLHEDAKYGAHTRVLKRRYRQLEDCLYSLKDRFHSREYHYLSHKAEKRLDKTLYALQDVREGIYSIPEQYSYHYKPSDNRYPNAYRYAGNSRQNRR